jgi:hypothetical protein
MAVSMAIAAPVGTVDQVAEVIFTPLLEFQLHSPGILAGESERQTLPVPAVKVTHEVNLVSPD